MMRFLSLGRASVRGMASIAAAKQVKRRAVTRFDLTPRLLNILREKHANLDLIRSMYGLNVSLDGKSLFLEGEDDVVASLSPRFHALQSAHDETQVIEALSSLLGEPIRIQMGMRLLALEKKTPIHGVMQPFISERRTWIIGTSDNVAHVWSDDESVASEAAHLLSRWSTMTKGLQDGKNFDAELLPHASFSWLERNEIQALRLEDTLLDKSKDLVRIWAVDSSSLERAKRFFSLPYRPEGAQDAILQFELVSDENYSETFNKAQVLDRVSSELTVWKDDPSIRLLESSPNSIKVETFWNWDVVLRAITRHMQSVLRGNSFVDNRLSIATVVSDETSIARSQDDASTHFEEGELSILKMRVSSSMTETRMMALVCANSAQTANAGKLFLDPTPGLVKLKLGAFRDMQQTVSEAFISRIGRDLLGWGEDARHLKHWGRDWFSATAVDDSQANSMQDSFSKLAVAIVDEPNHKGAGYRSGVAIWHMDKGRRMVVARDKDTLDAYLVDIKKPIRGRTKVASPMRS